MSDKHEATHDLFCTDASVGAPRAFSGKQHGSECLDFAGLDEADADKVRTAIARGENFHGYIPEESLQFVLRNFRTLAEMGALEAPWLDAYVHASHFSELGIAKLQEVFDACNRDLLRELKPVGESPSSLNDQRFTLFRGCAGPVHSMGMSWTPSLDKAIWYAAHHIEHYDLGNPAVYVSIVSASEIYCRLDRYDDDFIVHPSEAWHVAVPESEYRLNRPR